MLKKEAPRVAVAISQHGAPLNAYRPCSDSLLKESTKPCCCAACFFERRAADCGHQTFELRTTARAAAVAGPLLALPGQHLEVLVAAPPGEGPPCDSVETPGSLFCSADARRTALPRASHSIADAAWLRLRHEPALTTEVSLIPGSAFDPRRPTRVR